MAQLSRHFGDPAVAMILPIMGRSHRPRGPRYRTSIWQPVPLRLPIDRPASEPEADRRIRHPMEDELDRELDRPGQGDDGDDVGGKHVIVIDLA